MIEMSTDIELSDTIRSYQNEVFTIFLLAYQIDNLDEVRKRFTAFRKEVRYHLRCNSRQRESDPLYSSLKKIIDIRPAVHLPSALPYHFQAWAVEAAGYLV